MAFKDRLKKLRGERGMTQDDLARALDLPASTIRRYEITEESVPKKERLEAIANYFGVTVDYLLGRDTNEHEIPLSKTELILKKIVQKYNLDLTEPGAQEHLEDLIKFSLKHHRNQE